VGPGGVQVRHDLRLLQLASAPILNGIFCTIATFLTERNGRAFKSWGNAELRGGRGRGCVRVQRPAAHIFAEVAR
jgi:hypothetical protein